MVILIYMLKTVKYFRHVLPAENPFHITSISRNCSSFHEEQSGAYFLKLVSAIFYRTFISYQMIALQKLCKILFISYKKLFSLSRFSYFCISTFTSFSPSQPLLQRGWKINLKVCDVINCLNKNSITHFVCYLKKEKRYDIETLCTDRVLNKEHFYWKIMQKMCTRGYSQTPF